MDVAGHNLIVVSGAIGLPEGRREVMSSRLDSMHVGLRL